MGKALQKFLGEGWKRSINQASTTRLERWCNLLAGDLRGDEVGGLLDGADLLGALLVDGHVELLLEGHHDLDGVERVGAEVGELGVGGDLLCGCEWWWWWYGCGCCASLSPRSRCCSCALQISPLTPREARARARAGCFCCMLPHLVDVLAELLADDRADVGEDLGLVL